MNAGHKSTRYLRDPRCAGRIIEGRAALVTGHDNKLQLLNPSGTTIWRLAEQGTTIDQLVAAVVDEFAVDAETARRDIELCVADLIRRRILIEHEGAGAPESLR